jgi:hypothetical protein
VNDYFTDNPWEAVTVSESGSADPMPTQTTATPRFLLKATYDVKEAWCQMLFQEFGPGGCIPETYGDDFGREHLLWALAICRHVNGRTGETFVSNSTIGQMLGYTGNNYPGTAAVKMLVELGMLTENGNRGRAKRVRLSIPTHLAASDDYAGLGESVVGQVIADTKTR